MSRRPLDIRVSDTADEYDRRALVDGLIAYNEQRAGLGDSRPLVVLIRDSNGATVGGLWGRTGYGWLFVEMLFVPERLRGQGLGTQVMELAESEALARGCHGVWLDTFEFQARGFYEQLGYRCFGELEDYPAGFSRYFMTKTLDARRDTSETPDR